MTVDSQTRLFFGGRIFTSQGDDDTLHEALLVRDGTVQYVGEEYAARGLLQVCFTAMSLAQSQLC